MEDRGKPRHPISVPGRYRTGSGVAKDVDILDLSETGCRFFDRFGRMIAGTEISLRIGAIGPVIATVRWCRQQVVGVEFEKPLYGPVFEHIRDELDTRKREG
ncbi:PilZ domain-containing protein [Altererythrobacter sp. H2]|uniref:PilZ domain-containing protein n=1 Tax=Altererythrobacter sp. H2 TaxID=3108391 RepID=UPI002B4BB6FB|nr:PilZ domain-containing protein [Altererythrobacter sp. H2]WRK94938.1 PilZ domain-containing protein [Altererythrobacter sp. H2]